MNFSHPLRIDCRLPAGGVTALPLAGLATRFAAWLIDLALCLAALAVFNVDLRPRWFGSADSAAMASVVMFFALPVVYGFAFELCWHGQTLGKRWLRLRTVDARGGRLAGWQVAVRNALRIVDALPQLSLVGGMACAVTARTQRLGDLAARTVVVRDDRGPSARRIDPVPGRTNALRDLPGLAARLRERIAPEDAVLALRTLWRRDALDPAVRAELFGEFAARFRIVVPPSAAHEEGESGDEAFVGNVVEILFDPCVGNDH